MAACRRCAAWTSGSNLAGWLRQDHATPDAGSVGLAERWHFALSRPFAALRCQTHRLLGLKRSHGFIFQAFHLLPTFTALENVQIPYSRNRPPAAERRDTHQCVAQIRWVGALASSFSVETLWRVSKMSPSPASTNGPSVFLADEPTGNLDSENTKNILELIIRLRREQDMTLVLVTHDPRPHGFTDDSDEGRYPTSQQLRPQPDMTFFTIIVRGLLHRAHRTHARGHLHRHRCRQRRAGRHLARFWRKLGDRHEIARHRYRRH